MKGILFKDWKIKAIAEDDREWQTRRVIKPQPTCNCEQKHITRFKDGSVNFFYEHHNTPIHYKPRYQVGEVYIKEAFMVVPSGVVYGKEKSQFVSLYLEHGIEIDAWLKKYGYGKSFSPRFMPAWAARYFIKITDIRVERLQEISLADIYAEGCPLEAATIFTDPMSGYETKANAYEWYHDVWDSINPNVKWDTNPWVWRICFVKVSKP